MAGGFQKKPSGDSSPIIAGRGIKAMKKQMKEFVRIKNAGGEISDLYIRAPGDEKFFFAGRLANESASIDQALKMQKALCIDHIKSVVPGLPDRLQFFRAPGNSEVAVAKNECRLHEIKSDGNSSNKSPSLKQVGFMPEIYEAGEKVYYTRKADDGSCAAPPSRISIVDSHNF